MEENRKIKFKLLGRVNYNIESLDWGLIETDGSFTECASIDIASFAGEPLAFGGLSANAFLLDGECIIRVFGPINERICETRTFSIQGETLQEVSSNCSSQALGGGWGTYISVFKNSSPNGCTRQVSVLNEVGELLVGPFDCSWGNMFVSENNYSDLDMSDEDMLRIYDETGRMIHEGPAHVGYGLHYFSNGLYPCRSNTGDYGFINEQGSWVITPQFDEAHSFSSGLAAVKDEGLWGYVDSLGQISIPLRYESAKDFIGTFASVTVVEGRIRKQRIINSDGAFASEIFGQIFPIADDIFVTRSSGSGTAQWNAINSLGDVIIPYSEMYISYH